MNNKKLIVNQKKYGGDSSVISARIPVSLIRRIDKNVKCINIEKVEDLSKLSEVIGC